MWIRRKSNCWGWTLALLEINMILSCSCIGESVDQVTTSVSNMVALISKKFFATCDIILGVNYVNEGKRQMELVEAIQENLGRKFAMSEQQLYALRFNTLRVKHGLVVASKTRGSVEGNYFHRFASLSKYRENCALVILVLDSIERDLGGFLFDLLTPKQLEISKKDEDHYVFIGGEEVGKGLMLSPEFGCKIKYKILIPLPSPPYPGNPGSSISYEPEFLTVCFFCNGGKAIVQSLDFGGGMGVEGVESVEQLFPDFVKNHNGSELIAAISTRTIQRTEMYVDRQGRYQAKRGLYFMILGVIKERLGFHLKIIPSFGDGGTGLLLENGTWLGSVGNVLGGTAHIGMVCAQTYQRNKVVGFAFSFKYEWITFTTGRPHGLHSWTTILKPFTVEMWIAVVSSTAGVIGTFLAIRSHLPRGWKLGEMFQYIIGSFLEQSYKSPKDPAVLVLCGFWLSFGVVVSTAYRSKLFTFLVFPEVSVAPETFNALANSRDFTWGLMYLKGAMYAVFKSSTEDTYVKIFQNWVLVNKSYDCFQRTTQENFACISWQSLAEYNAHKNFTDKSGNKFLVEAPTGTFFIPCGITLEKRAIFRTNFDKIIHWSHDTGLVGKWEEMDWGHVRKMRFDWERAVGHVVGDRDALDQKGPQPLENVNLLGAYSVLVAFSCLALLVYGLELAQLAWGRPWLKKGTRKTKKEIYE